ncbi:hypothetical protein [Streptomyces botrytidirepellens]|nr:hypothetical protein [Streptomyces botrytidirepellens]
MGPRNKEFAPAGTFEAECRTIFGEHRIYLRHVPAPDPGLPDDKPDQ